MAKRRDGEGLPAPATVRMDQDAAELARMAAHLKGESIVLYLSELVRKHAPGDIAANRGVLDAMSGKASKAKAKAD
jgi:hypothetical protein